MARQSKAQAQARREEAERYAEGFGYAEDLRTWREESDSEEEYEGMLAETILEWQSDRQDASPEEKGEPIPRKILYWAKAHASHEGWGRY